MLAGAVMNNDDPFRRAVEPACADRRQHEQRDGSTASAAGGIIGAAATFPSGWRVNRGFLVGPGANLSGANLSGANLAFQKPERRQPERREPQRGATRWRRISKEQDITGTGVSAGAQWAVTTCPAGVAPKHAVRARRLARIVGP